MGEHDHLHEQHHTHDETDTLAHIHTHRNIIGFDEHGIPTVIVESGHMEGEADDPQSFIRDYRNAVSEYRKTFPSKQDVIGQTPDPAVRDLLLRMEQLGIDTAFDRFDRQKPQCNYGLAGICCKICNRRGLALSHAAVFKVRPGLYFFGRRRCVHCHRLSVWCGRQSHIQGQYRGA